MIQHDYTFETLASAPVKQTDVVVARQIASIYGYSDDALIWSSSDALMSVDIYSTGAFLSVATKKAVVKLLGLIDGTTAGDMFQIRLGLYDTNLSSFNYISQGFYVVETVEFNYDAGSTTITMYDFMWLAGKSPYNDPGTETGFTYPASVSDLAQKAAIAIKATLDPEFVNLPNADYQILADPYANISNATIQTVIQEIAGATGTTARMSDTILKFVPFVFSREVVS